jgi:cephalosporin-C deacetylase-like acetyl esterase
MTIRFSRRAFLATGIAATVSIARGEPAPPEKIDVHRQLLELAAAQEKKRRARFAAVKTVADLEALQKELRQKFLALLDGLPAASGPPPVQLVDRIDANDYTVDKLVYESFPGYFVPALLYLPKNAADSIPAILSPCGHSSVGKADATYQTLHINLAKRGYAVLTYDPVGQGERSQFWDAVRGRSKFNLSCGEHAVLGNPLYLLGTSLARYRIWDGMRGIDYLTSLAQVDPQRIGCIGNSGGGTLTAYISALDPRVLVAIPSCYITTLPRRMGNRIEKDPDADPEQDIFGFVGEGIDHVGLLALRVPRPTMLGTAVRDFFPIEGARETFDEVQRLYAVAGVPERISRAEADGGHGLSLTLRQAAYAWFDKWLAGRKEAPREAEIPVTPRPAKELLVCADGQVNVTFRSKPLLPMVAEEFRRKMKPPAGALKDLLGGDAGTPDFHLTKTGAVARPNMPQVICINGVETGEWQTEAAFVAALAERGVGVTILDPRGTGKLKPAGLESLNSVKGHTYADALCGAEENIAYNAFLCGTSLISLRVADVIAGVARIRNEKKAVRVVLCGRRDAALVALFAAALEPAIAGLAVEEIPLSYWPLFEAEGRTINAASILPRMLQVYGDIAAVFAAIAPRWVLAAAATARPERALANLDESSERFTVEPKILLDWLKTT